MLCCRQPNLDSRGQAFWWAPQWGPVLNLVGPIQGPFLLVCSKGIPSLDCLANHVRSFSKLGPWAMMLPFFAGEMDTSILIPTTIIIHHFMYLLQLTHKVVAHLDHPLFIYLFIYLFMWKSRSWIVGPFCFHIIRFQKLYKRTNLENGPFWQQDKKKMLIHLFD